MSLYMQKHRQRMADPNYIPGSSKHKWRKGRYLPGYEGPTKENRTRLNRNDRHQTKQALHMEMEV